MSNVIEKHDMIRYDSDDNDRQTDSDIDIEFTLQSRVTSHGASGIRSVSVLLPGITGFLPCYPFFRFSAVFGFDLIFDSDKVTVVMALRSRWLILSCGPCPVSSGHQAI